MSQRHKGHFTQANKKPRPEHINNITWIATQCQSASMENLPVCGRITKMTVGIHSPTPGNGGGLFLCKRGQALDTPILAFNILIHQRARNSTIGIKTDTLFLRSLAQFMRKSHNEQLSAAVTTVTEVAYLKANIEEYQSLALRLTEHIIANIDDDDTRNQGVHIVKSIDAYVTHLAEQLETLWQQT